MTRFSSLKLEMEQVPLKGSGQIDSESHARDCAVAKAGHLLFVSGYFMKVPTYKGVPAVGVLDITKKEWRWVGRKGARMRFQRGFLYEDGMYVVEGTDQDWQTIIGVFRFDLVSEEWTEVVTTGDVPIKRTYFCGDYLEDLERFVVFGGRDTHTTTKEVCYLSMPHCQWVKPMVKGKLPSGRSEHCSCVFKNKIFYYGGFGARGYHVRAGILELTFSKDSATWTHVKTTGHAYIPRVRSSLFAFQGRLLLCGGSGAGGMHNINVYNPEEQTFSEEDTNKGWRSGVGYTPFQTPDDISFGLIGGNMCPRYYIRVSVKRKS